jgi:hypothetical protein
VDQRRTHRGLTEEGVSSVQFLLAAALALSLFLVFANLVVVQYGRGAVRSALEQGARAGALSASVEACELKAAEVLQELLGGRMSDGITPRCSLGPSRVTAEASATFDSWTGLTPDFDISISTESALEVLP